MADVTKTENTAFGGGTGETKLDSGILYGERTGRNSSLRRGTLLSRISPVPSKGSLEIRYERKERKGKKRKRSQSY